MRGARVVMLGAVGALVGVGAAMGQAGGDAVAERRAAARAAAQAAAARRRPPATGRVERTGCPAEVPPAVSDALARAGDFVEMQRVSCVGECAVYTVRVSGDGRVAWRGVTGVKVKGEAAGTIEPDAARALMQRVADRGFARLCTRYATDALERGTVVTTLSIAGVVKRVEDYGESAPGWLRGVDLDIDRVGNTHRWRHGEPRESFGAVAVRDDVTMPKTGVTDLMRAAVLADTGSLGKSLEMLPDVNAKDVSGWTALMYAGAEGPMAAMTMLLRAGADPFARTAEGETVLHAVVVGNDRAEDRVALLVGLGVDVNGRDDRGVSALMVACKYYVRTGRVIRELLDDGADPSKRDEEGRTAADYMGAAAEGDLVGKGRFEAVRGMLGRR